MTTPEKPASEPVPAPVQAPAPAPANVAGVPGPRTASGQPMIRTELAYVQRRAPYAQAAPYVTGWLALAGIGALMSVIALIVVARTEVPTGDCGRFGCGSEVTDALETIANAWTWATIGLALVVPSGVLALWAWPTEIRRVID
ncbi:hypothetical protein ACFWBN_37615 [Streptomyces sp. NPDC059989]|uniref:hypothetical protein n=1 Tax=Streptomyces sp. NPDC059989 TaxID=3347026 RepID=UPI0036893958